ncbi:MAG: hypothetical protein N4A47_00940 [Clostridia bacterium]|nr:hypothetical protein [Clostridia bacterium]
MSIYENIPTKEESKKNWLSNFCEERDECINSILFTIKRYSREVKVEEIKDALTSAKESKELTINDFESLGLYKIYLVEKNFLKGNEEKRLEEIKNIEKEELEHLGNKLKNIIQIN